MRRHLAGMLAGLTTIGGAVIVATTLATALTVDADNPPTTTDPTVVCLALGCPGSPPDTLPGNPDVLHNPHTSVPTTTATAADTPEPAPDPTPVVAAPRFTG